jgi:excisionase family DNA binding protein
MDVMDAEYLTIRDLSSYLQIKVKTLYPMVPALPHYKVGRLIRFRRDEIDAWMRSRRVSLEEPKEPKERDENAGKKEKGDAKGDTVKKKPRKAGRPTMTRDTDVDRLVRRSINECKGRKPRAGSN